MQYVVLPGSTIINALNKCHFCFIPIAIGRRIFDIIIWVYILKVTVTRRNLVAEILMQCSKRQLLSFCAHWLLHKLLKVMKLMINYKCGYNLPAEYEEQETIIKWCKNRSVRSP